MRNRTTSSCVVAIAVLVIILGVEWGFLISALSSDNNTQSNSANAGAVSLSLDKSSKLTLTGDTYVKSLTNADSTNSNINFNGYKLYVNGTAIN